MGRPLNIDKLAGLTSEAGKQLAARAKISTSHRSASLIKQKNSTKFLVEDSSGERGVCKLVDKANTALLAGEMTITAYPASGASFHVARITNKFIWNFAGQRSRWSFNAATGKVMVGSEYVAPAPTDPVQAPPVTEPTPPADYTPPPADPETP